MRNKKLSSGLRTLSFFFLAGFAAVSAHASNEPTKATVTTGRSTNMKVESSELEPFDLNKKTGDDDRVKFYKDENTAVGFNEDGDPSVATRF